MLLQSLKDAHEENLVLRAKLLEYQWLEESLRQRTRELNERMKELDCLYTVSSSLLDHHMPFERVLAMIVKDIPRGWQYPKATGVRLVFNGREYILMQVKFRLPSPPLLNKVFAGLQGIESPAL